MAKTLNGLVKTVEPGRSWRIQRSGVRGHPEEAATTALVVRAIEAAGIPVRRYSMGSPVNCDSYHVEARFEDGGLRASTGTYWYGEKGAVISGVHALAFVGARLGLKPRGALLAELRAADPGIEELIQQHFVAEPTPPALPSSRRRHWSR